MIVYNCRGLVCNLKMFGYIMMELDDGNVLLKKNGFGFSGTSKGVKIVCEWKELVCIECPLSRGCKIRDNECVLRV